MSEQKYDKNYHPVLAKKIAGKYGADFKELSDIFDVSEQTIKRWKEKHLDFEKALLEGYDEFRTHVVEETLFKKATGMELNEDEYEVIDDELVHVKRKTKQVAPDTRASLEWLYSRGGDRWRGVKETRKISFGATINEHNINIEDGDAKGEISEDKKARLSGILQVLLDTGQVTIPSIEEQKEEDDDGTTIEVEPENTE